MGFTTYVHILNDGLSMLERHPEEFVRQIMDNHYDGGTAGVGNHVNMLQIHPSRHADTFQLVASHRNMSVSLSKWDRETEELAERHPDIIRDMITLARRELDALEESLPPEEES